MDDIYKESPPGLDFTTPWYSEWGITVGSNLFEIIFQLFIK
jgi:hypothetical protein